MEYNNGEVINNFQAYLYMTGELEKLQFNLDLRLCDIAAQAFANGDDTKYQMCAKKLKARYNELRIFQKHNYAKISKYVDAKIAEGFEEYWQVKADFLERIVDKFAAN